MKKYKILHIPSGNYIKSNMERDEENIYCLVYLEYVDLFVTEIISSKILPNYHRKFIEIKSVIVTEYKKINEYNKTRLLTKSKFIPYDLVFLDKDTAEWFLDTRLIYYSRKSDSEKLNFMCRIMSISGIENFKAFEQEFEIDEFEE